MGMSPKKFSKKQRERLGIDGSGRPALAPALQAWVRFVIRGDPPTTTHQDKEITFITGKSGKRHATLVDSLALRAARGYYLLAIPERREMIPVMSPVVGIFEWFFETPEADRWGQYCTNKPDPDNLMKVAADALAQRGYLVNDAHLVRATAIKRWTRPGSGSTRLYLRTLHGAGDLGSWIATDESNAGELYPVPWLIKDDLDAFRKAVNGPARARNGGR